MKKVAVCVPTFNEADMIEITVKKIDAGLYKYAKNFETCIVNCDNSTDETGKIFQKIETKAKKIYIKSKEIGKGINLINFFNYCKKEKIDYAITLDADVISMQDIWIKNFLNELINQKANYVVPSYKRSRFEGSTTNHFAYPLIYSLTGMHIRQPIGGDFAFDKNYIDYIVKQPYNESIKKYGIDIFMTLNAVYGNFNIKTLELGEKIHKPSFNKMYNMFGEVLNGAVYTIQSQKKIILDIDKTTDYKEKINLIKSRKFSHKSKANELLEISYNKLKKKSKNYLFEFGYNGNKSIDDEEWEQIMCKLIEKILNNNIKFDFEDFVDIFIIRAVSYWNKVEKLSAMDSEKIIINVATRLRKDVLKMGGVNVC